MVVDQFDAPLDQADEPPAQAEPLQMPYEHGCVILREHANTFRVKHQRFPGRHWETNDLNTARMICDELNCE